MAESNSTPKTVYPQDLTGIRFGKLVAECAGRKVGSCVYWKCRCDCGGAAEVRRSSLISGGSSSCGCWHKKYPAILPGMKYGMLTATKPDPARRRYWVCECECGKTKSVCDSSLKRGIAMNCGCRKGEAISKSLRRHGMSRSQIYTVWVSMISRSRGADPSPTYANIRVCDGWKVFENFYCDMGDRPTDKHTIDRIENSGHYTCGRCAECLSRGDKMNCRWATRRQQSENRFMTRWITHNGQTKTLASWAREVGLSRNTISNRLSIGWSVKDALSLPLRAKVSASKT